jgi:hypothetical protein
MTLDTKDLKRLQWAIAFLLIMSAIGGGAVWTVEQMKKSSTRALQEAAAARKDIQSKLARARDEQQELTEKLNRFRVLKERGLIGPERRLDWIEAIARIKAARRIFKLDYEFAPQRSLDASILPGAERRAASNSCRARCGCRSICCMKTNCWTSLATSAPICARRWMRWCMSAPAPSSAWHRAPPTAAARPCSRLTARSNGSP